MSTTTTSRKPRGVRSPARWAHIPLVLMSLVLIFPFYWSVVMASGTMRDFYSYPPKLLSKRTKHIRVNDPESIAPIDANARSAPGIITQRGCCYAGCRCSAAGGRWRRCRPSPASSR